MQVARANGGRGRWPWASSTSSRTASSAWSTTPSPRPSAASSSRVELASALRREVDERAAVVGRDRTVVPNEFTIELSTADYDQVEAWGAEALADEFAANVTDHAASQRYAFVGPVTVSLLRGHRAGGRPVQGAQRHRARRGGPGGEQPRPAPGTRWSTSTGSATCSPGRSRSSAAARRRTSSSTTRASPGGTSRSASRPTASSPATWARPTDCSSRATRSRRRRCSTATPSPSGAPGSCSGRVANRTRTSDADAMSELTITLLRLGYLALLWVFVLSAIAVLRRDLYGTRIVDRRAAAHGAAARRRRRHRAPRRRPQPHAARRAQRRRPTGSSSPRVRCAGTIVPLGSSSVLIGRAPGCTLVLDDDYSSSRHARIFPQGGAVVRRGPRLDERHVRRRPARRGADARRRPVHPSAWARA